MSEIVQKNLTNQQAIFMVGNLFKNFMNEVSKVLEDNSDLLKHCNFKKKTEVKKETAEVKVEIYCSPDESAVSEKDIGENTATAAEVPKQEEVVVEATDIAMKPASADSLAQLVAKTEELKKPKNRPPPINSK